MCDQIWQKIKNGDSRVLKEFVDDNAKLFIKMMHYGLSQQYQIDEMISDMYLIVWTTSKKFNPDKGMSFKTFVASEFRFRAMRMASRTKRRLQLWEGRVASEAVFNEEFDYVSAELNSEIYEIDPKDPQIYFRF